MCVAFTILSLAAVSAADVTSSASCETLWPPSGGGQSTSGASLLQVSSFSEADEHGEAVGGEPLEHNDVEFRPLIVIPGLGSAGRAGNVLRNIRLFNRSLGPRFSCILTIWAKNTSDPIFAPANYAPCKVVYDDTPLFGCIKDVPALDTRRASHVLLVLDDLEMNEHALLELHRFMEKTGSDMVSASYEMSWCELMKPRPQREQAARGTTYMEINNILFTHKSFQCFQELIDTKTNSMGYGYDFYFVKKCATRPAICDACTVKHLSHGSYNGTMAKEEMWKWVEAHPEHRRFFSRCDNSSSYKLFF